MLGIGTVLATNKVTGEGFVKSKRSDYIKDLII